jgi:uncharacterized protein YfeS
MNHLKVESIDHLKTLASAQGDDFADFVLLIAGGLARSSKRIIYYHNTDEFYIINEIDESFQEVGSKDLHSETNLIAGIDSGCLYAVISL